MNFGTMKRAGWYAAAIFAMGHASGCFVAWVATAKAEGTAASHVTDVACVSGKASAAFDGETSDDLALSVVALGEVEGQMMRTSIPDVWYEDGKVTALCGTTTAGSVSKVRFIQR